MTADFSQKLSTLAAAAKYDASCASSGSSSSAGGNPAGKGSVYGNQGSGYGDRGSFGVRVPAGVCHSWTGDGRCVSLLKVLYSNVCRYNCAYCVNRVSSDTPRASFTEDELVSLTCEFYRRNYIEGLFLSSGIFSDPDIVMEKLTAVARKLRREAGFGGYIHLKIIPGSGETLIREAGLWADRLSANIELPTEKSLRSLAPEKSGKLIFGAMGEVSLAKAQAEEDRRHKLKAPAFAPAGQSTQLIVGASGEDDRTIIGLSGALYKKYSLKRVYYSAYMPVVSDASSGLPEISSPPLLREHRLYQADWLMRFYHFESREILDEAHPFLDTALDPKTVWALNHPERFPVEIKKADYEELLRVPGLGAVSARRILGARRQRPLNFEGLRRLGVVLKRARYFITLGGAFLDRFDDPSRLRRILSGGEDLQLPLFNF
ncbi:MAG: putative DNA modification/repair radical SAM protein [Treponema sp.]|jgi:putative DNA modification/repair radical SAM protein|nr:putative DNA modification/repair radical SAM protein [Treponema sp.]